VIASANPCFGCESPGQFSLPLPEVSVSRGSFSPVPSVARSLSWSLPPLVPDSSEYRVRGLLPRDQNGFLLSPGRAFPTSHTGPILLSVGAQILRYSFFPREVSFWRPLSYLRSVNVAVYSIRDNRFLLPDLSSPSREHSLVSCPFFYSPPFFLLPLMVLTESSHCVDKREESFCSGIQMYTRS